MAHWLVYVIVPASTVDLVAQVTLLLNGSQTRPEVNFPVSKRPCACGFAGYSIDPECEICRGTGIYRFVMDPSLYWEEWTVGGRFEGKLKGNRCLVRELPNELHEPDVIVTPEGVWHESAGKALPLPSTPEEASHWHRWEVQYRSLLASYPNELAVVVDAYD